MTTSNYHHPLKQETLIHSVQVRQIYNQNQHQQQQQTLLNHGCGGDMVNGDDDNDDDSSWIHLKLDDKLFATQRSTLLSIKDTFFSIMFQRGSKFHHARDESHPNRPFLIDRSPAHFAVVLDYLRTGELIVGPATNLRGVLLDARYYNLPGLVAQLEELSRAVESREGAGEAELSRQQVVKALSRVHVGARVRLQGVNLTGLDLSHLDLSNANLRNSNLTRCNLSRCNLEGADLRKCLLHGANLTGAKMGKAVMRRCKATHAVLDNANLQDADLSFSDLSNASLRFANMGNANMASAMMHHVDLTGANLKKTTLKGAILTGIERNETYLPMGGVLH